jgi:nucleoside-triphosphatase
VDPSVLEDAADKLLAPDSAVALYLVDEIGKMECLSPRFVAAMRALLARGKPVITTVVRQAPA